MTQSRRQFIAQASAIGATAGFGLAGPAAQAFAAGGRGLEQAAPRRILFLGGTGFIGPHIVNRLLEKGHEVTLFNRGNRDELFPDLELITGNRIVDVEPGLTPLEDAVKGGRRWDAVIDTSNVHTWTEHSAALLKDAAEQYVYTSSMSVYADNSTPGQTEADGETATMPADEAARIDRLPYDMQYFGAVKRLTEVAAERYFPGRATIVRPGLIVGPRDGTHRFTYWPWRVRNGGEVLAPGAPDHRIMFIDARDLANFIVTLIESRSMGIFNANGPTDGPFTIGELLRGCRAATESDATFTWCDGDWLAERGVMNWQQMPVWINPNPAMAGFHGKSLTKAIAAGLSTRPLRETVIDTLAWLDETYIPAVAERGGTYAPGGRTPGITPEREAELLAEWHARDDASGGGAGAGADGEPLLA